MSLPGGGLELGTAFVEIRPKVSEFRAKLLEGINPGLLTAGIAVGAVVTGALFEVGESFEKATDKIRVTTGFTGEKLEELSGVFKEVFTDVPTTMGAASEAVATLAQRLGLTGDPLRQLSDQVLELSRVTKTDLGGNVEAVTQVFNNWGISAQDQGAKLDELFRASQATGVGVADLASTMASAGSVTRTIGLSFEQSAALIGLLSKAGVSATAVMMPLSRAIATAAKEGKDATSVFSDVWTAIKEAPDATAAAGAAIDVFGARAGPRLAGLIREGQLSYDDLVATVAGGSDTIMKAGEDTQHAGEKIHLAWNRVLVALEPAGEAVANLATILASGLAPAVDDVTNGLSALWERAQPTFATLQAGFAGLKAAFSGEGVTSDGFVGAMERIGVTLRNVWDIAAQFFSTLRTGFTDDEGTGVEKFALRVRAIVLPVLDALRDSFQKVGAFVSEHIEPIMVSLGAAAAYLAGAAALGGLAAVVSGVVSVLGVLVGALASPALAIAALIAGLVYAYQTSATFRNVVNGVVSWLIANVPPAFFAVRDAAVSAFDWINTNVVPIVQRVIGFVVQQVQHLAAWWSQHWNSIRDAVRNVLIVVGAIIYGAVQAILFVWDHFGDQIMAVVTFVWAIVQDIIQTAVRVIGDVIALFVDLLSGNWGKAWDDVKDILAAAWDFIVTAVSAGIQLVLDFFISLPGNIVGALADLAPFLLDAGIAAMNGLWDGIKETATNVLSWFADLPGRLVGALGDVGSLLLDVGKKLIQGFIDGIGSMFGSVKDKLGDLAGSLTSWKGPPDKDAVLLYNNGRLVIGGFIDGLESMYGSVHQTLASLGSSVSVAGVRRAGPAAQLAFAGTGAGGGPVVHIGQITIDLRGIAPERAERAGADAGRGFTQELAKRGLRVEVRAIG